MNTIHKMIAEIIGSNEYGVIDMSHIAEGLPEGQTIWAVHTKDREPLLICSQIAILTGELPKAWSNNQSFVSYGVTPLGAILNVIRKARSASTPAH